MVAERSCAQASENSCGSLYIVVAYKELPVYFTLVARASGSLSTLPLSARLHCVYSAQQQSFCDSKVFGCYLQLVVMAEMQKKI